MKPKDGSPSTKETILQAANQVILAQGAEALTLEAVAKAAGISKGGLLYHFPSKAQLIRAMIASMMVRVDAALQAELDASGGDYLTAYIRASFQTQTGPDQISYALLAAIANDPELIDPLRERFARMQAEITAAAPSAELGTIIRLALDGLWISDLFGFAPPSPALREKMLPALLAIVKNSAEAHS